jgi:CdiI immunity protein
MMHKNLEALKLLLGCYFHQDWPDEFSDEVAALEAVIRSEPEDQLAAGVDEITNLLVAQISENDLRAILIDQVGCYFDPSSEGISYVQWLERVRGRFAKAMK